MSEFNMQDAVPFDFKRNDFSFEILDEASIKIIKRLNAAGYACYAVGGCVRDALCGFSVYDIDLASSAPPNEIKRVFRDCKLDLKGERFGTVGVIIDNKEYEITSFRRDGYYFNSRTPEDVEFCTDLFADAYRRDFTCNALYYNFNEGLIDLVGGVNDLKARVLRTVGDPYERFGEDALRILRALRFCSVFGFDIENQTKDAIFAKKGDIKKLSAERVYCELSRMLFGKNADFVIKNFFGVLVCAVPELSVLTQSEIELTASAIIKADKDLVIRLSLLLNFLSLSAAENSLKKLKVESRIAKSVLFVLKNKNLNFLFSENDSFAIKSALKEFGVEQCLNVLRFRLALQFGEQEKQKILARIGEINEILSRGEVYSLKNLAVNGCDIKALGISGKSVGFVLNELLSCVISGEIANEKIALTDKAKTIIRAMKIEKNKTNNYYSDD